MEQPWERRRELRKQKSITHLRTKGKGEREEKTEEEVESRVSAARE